MDYAGQHPYLRLQVYVGEAPAWLGCRRRYAAMSDWILWYISILIEDDLNVSDIPKARKASPQVG